MPTARTSTAAHARPKRAAKADNAIAMLIADHDKVKKLFKAFEKEEDDAGKEKIAGEICTELKIHTRLEEEIFYPAAREAIDEEDLMDEAVVEHASAKDLISQIEAMGPDDELYDAKVTVLGEYVDHHVKEEQKQMFPKVRKAKLDLEELGERMKARKEELLQSGRIS
jgi:hemerythrin superfamily protein